MGRDGFTLVELVVVVLILGIIAAIALPKLLDTAGDANRNAAEQSLSAIRDAIEFYKLQNGEYPGDDGDEADFKADIRAFLRGRFPRCPVGNLNDNVKVLQDGNPLSASGSQGWKYDQDSGEFIINDPSFSSL